MSDAAIDVLKEAISDRTEGYVFLSSTGTRYHVKLRSFSREVRKQGLRVSNGSYFRFHDLRHVFGTWLKYLGVADDEIQLLMNHSNIKTTKRYTTIARSKVAHHVNKIARIERNVIKGRRQRSDAGKKRAGKEV